MTEVQKSRRILDSIQARDTSAMGYEAKLRHNDRIEQARRVYEGALAASRAKQTEFGSTAAIT